MKSVGLAWEHGPKRNTACVREMSDISAVVVPEVYNAPDLVVLQCVDEEMLLQTESSSLLEKQ